MEAAKGPAATKGNMMVDSGAGITLVTKVWAEAHGLRISAPPLTSVRGAAGQAVEVIGTVSMTLQLSPTLEVDVANVAVSTGAFYQALLGCDLLEGKPGVLGPATISMGDGGSVQWKQEKIGCIAVAPLLRKAASVNPASAEYLPPPPPQPAPTRPIVTLKDAGVKMDATKLAEMAALAKERDEQRLSSSCTTQQWRGLLDRAQYLFRGLALPRNIAELVRQAFAVHNLRGFSTETVAARVLAKAQASGYEAALQELESMGIPSSPPPKKSA